MKIYAFALAFFSLSASASVDLSGNYFLLSERIGNCPSKLTLQMSYPRNLVGVKWDDAAENLRPIAGELSVIKEKEKWVSEMNDRLQSWSSEFVIRPFGFGRWEFSFRDTFMKKGNTLYFERLTFPFPANALRLSTVCFYAKARR